MFKKIVLGVLGVSIASAALTVVLPLTGEAQIGSTPVRVVNTPLPVSGNVNAAVSGNVGLAPGAMVGVSGPVTVDNSAGPVVVRDDGSGEFVVRPVYADIYPGQHTHEGIWYNVPSGKVLIVEYASFAVTMPTGQKPAGFALYEANGAVSHLGPTLIGTQPGYDYFLANQQMRMYIFQNESLSLYLSRGSANTGYARIEGTIYGRLVPIS